MIQLCNPEHSPTSLYIRYLFEQPITDQKKTLFFPLSYTQAQGHFIGEFKENEVEFITFINTEEIHKEDIAGKIRVLDRQLRKAFPDFKTTPHRKNIYLTEYSPLIDLQE